MAKIKLHSHRLAFFSKKGFTLIELLVVIGVLGVVSTFSVALILSIIRANRKNQNLLTVKQAGGYAIRTMASKIKESAAISGSCVDNMSSISLENQDRTIIGFTCGNNTIGRTGAEVGNLISASSGISLSNCAFSCLSSIGKPESVEIQFDLSLGSGAEAVSQSFKTTVSLRNY